MPVSEADAVLLRAVVEILSLLCKELCYLYMYVVMTGGNAVWVVRVDISA